MKGVMEFYDRTVAGWAEQWYADDSQLPVLKRFLEQLPARPRVLDLCCGAGYESMRLARLGAQVTGIDFSAESIAIARKHNPDMRFFVEDMLNDYSYVGEMDGIACIAGLVHIPPEQIRHAFERMAQTLKPGGYALLVVREGEGRLESQSIRIVDGETYDRAFYGYTPDALRQAADGIFEYACEICDDEESLWRNLLFKKL